MRKFPFNSFTIIGFCGRFFMIVLLSALTMSVKAQRVYTSNSVLASGNWYNLAVKQTGVHKIDLSFLNSLGLAGSISSSSIRLYGSGGAMLSESNAAQPPDDLHENAIMVVDGGDGLLNGSDYILFYAEGPRQWVKDSINKRFSHRTNIYSDKSFYFLTIGGTGKRIVTLQQTLVPNITVNSFNERLYHELDSVNFLASGKDWFGEEFANAPGKTLTRNFNFNIPGLQTDQSLTLISNAVSRSVGNPGSFNVTVNGQVVQQFNIPNVSGGVYDAFARQHEQLNQFTANQTAIQLAYNYTPGSLNAQGWLNWFEIFARSRLALSGSQQLLFRDWNSVGNNNAEYIVSNATANEIVWDVTYPHTPVRMQTSLQNNELRFINECSRLREYVAFNAGNALIPEAIGRIQNQDLHNIHPVDYIIVAYPPFLPQAQRLAQFHLQHSNLRSVVVTTEQVFNEFSSGIPDPVAIRDFVKMYYDRSAAGGKPKYLLLFGDASFDYKSRINGNTNFVPAYQTGSSLDPLSTYTSDDFFGFLDDNEDINSGLVTNLLDIGIGRIPAKHIDEAKNYVDKVEAYHAKESLGPWRNNLVFVADDEDFNLHLQDAEQITNTVSTVDSLLNNHKIYLDAYHQESGSGGSRYPKVNELINNHILNGTLIWNFNGHGGSSRLAEEIILDQQIVNDWNNESRLPLFITATCDFAPYDNPTINSLGENILVRPVTGGIALMTTTRVVFAFSNRIMNDNYLRLALQPGANGKYMSLGEAAKAAKNYTYQTSGDIANNRKFTLLGDPALTIGFPEWKVRTTKVNGLDVSAGADTLKSTDRVTVEGEVTDVQGNILSGFNGVVHLSVFDKIQTFITLANDNTSQPVNFKSQANSIFKGKASVVNGRFVLTFKVPKDINHDFGKGRFSFYAEQVNEDANGSFTGFIVGGTGTGAGSDTEGPVIKAYLNDEKFVNGGLSNENPVLLVELSDSSGINTAGNGIGHDIVATLDNDSRQFFILNDFFETELDDYQSGKLRFQLPSLEPGHHSLHIKAWDVMNNSSEYIIEFTVANDEDLVLAHVLNYPNPFTTKTKFWFEHNRPGRNLNVRIQVFTISGRVIKSIVKTINTEGNRSSDVEWDGRDEYGAKPGRGVYLYKLSVADDAGKKSERIGKLVIF